MTATLPRVDYAKMDRSEAERVWRDRTDKTAILRYAEGADHSSIEDKIWAILDRLSDEQILKYFSKRFGHNYNADAIAPQPVMAIEQNSRATSQKALAYCLAAQRRGEQPDYREVLNRIKDETAPAHSPQGQQNARSLSDRAMQYCKREQAAGRRVSYADVRSRFTSGELK